MAKTIDAVKFAEAFQKAVPAQVESMATKAADAEVKFGIASLAGGLDLGTLDDKFCAAWPKARGFILLAVRFLGLLRPTEAGYAKALVNAIDTTIVPTLCGPGE
jgi:hypothetical protein